VSLGVAESVVEESALAWFEELGWSVLHGPDIAPGEPLAERESYSDVILRDRLGIIPICRVKPKRRRCARSCSSIHHRSCSITGRSIKC